MKLLNNNHINKIPVLFKDNKMSALNDDNMVSNNHLHTTINQQFTINERSSIHYHDDDGNVD